MPNKDSQPLVSIITINFNNPEVTCELLSSLKKITYRNIEVIVVDNGSTKGDAAIISKRFPEIRLIRNKHNLGFAGGNNEGTKYATGKYLLYLNNDVEVSPEFLEPLVGLFENNPDAGMCSPKILNNQTGEIEYQGGTFINPLTTRNKKVKNYDEILSGIYETPLAHGAALLVSAAVVAETCLMPDIYFLYYEEHDWAEMFKRKGYKVYYNENSEVYHKSSVSVGHQSFTKIFYMTRGRILFLRRNIKGINKLIPGLFITFVTLPVHAITYIYKLQFNLLWAFLKGMIWHLGHFDIHKNPKLITDKRGNKIISNSYYKDN